MGVLDQVIKLKNQGVSDLDIINDLSQQGISPKDIDAALKQAQIKNAVSDFGDEEMQPSIMQDDAPTPSPLPQSSQPQQQEYQQQSYAPQEQTYVPQEQAYSQYQENQNNYYSPQQYSNYQDYNNSANADTIIEVAEQVFSDKIRKFQKQLDTTSENAIMLQTKLESVSERLKKIENTIDKLQIAILEKVGSYGQNLESIKKEMGMMQDSFSKMISK